MDARHAGRLYWSMGRPHLRLVAIATLLALAAVACSSSGDSTSAEPAATPSSSESVAGPSTLAPGGTPEATPGLDSIAVLGHSGATGTMSDPENTLRDARENSWATGENPAVGSIYSRLLRDHPAMEGHNYNLAVNGSTVDMLEEQLVALLEEAEVLPDVVMIQTIDNDMQCDGTDRSNYRPFGRTLDRALTRMEQRLPGVEFFVVSQWATVQAWATWAAHWDQHVFENSGTGPCDVFDAEGALRPAGIRSMTAITRGYWAQIERVCAAHPECFTDDRALEKEFLPEDDDVSSDLNHLAVEGHAKFAEIAWNAFPEEIKQAP